MSEKSTTAVSVKCEVCHEFKAKYKCPRCLLQTCCFSCVKQHKLSLGCNGQRDKTKYVCLKQFDDLQLLSDYRLLEDVDRKVDSTSRDQVKKHRYRPNCIKKLLSATRKRGIILEIVPLGFTKRTENTTYFDSKENTIYWHVQWIFPNVGTKYTCKKVKESSTLQTVLDDFFVPGMSDPIIRQKYCEVPVEDLKLYMKMEQRRANSVRYFLLDNGKSITDNLKDKLIIEYPTIHVVFGELVKDYPVIEEENCHDNSHSSDDNSESDDMSETEQNSRTIDAKLSVKPINGSVTVGTENLGETECEMDRHVSDTNLTGNSGEIKTEFVSDSTK